MKFFAIFLLALFAVIASAARPDFCNLPSSPGVGRAAVTRHFFNSKSGECETFIWGKVERGSNENRFETKEQCEATCKV